jgi:site-specific DNA recombinase
MAAAMLRDIWDSQAQKAVSAVDAEHDIEKLLDNVVAASNSRVIAAYETRNDALERRKLVLREKHRELDAPQTDFESLFELSLSFLSNVSNIWRNIPFECKRLVLKRTFSGHLEYCRESGFRTPQTTVPFAFLADSGLKREMVLLGRIELPASPLPRVRSTTELQQRSPSCDSRRALLSRPPRKSRQA